MAIKFLYVTNIYDKSFSIVSKLYDVDKMNYRLV